MYLTYVSNALLRIMVIGSSYHPYPSFLAVLIPGLQLHWTTKMPSLEMKRPWLHMGLFQGTWYVWFLKMPFQHLTCLHPQIQSIPHCRITTSPLWLPPAVSPAHRMKSGVICFKERQPSLMSGVMTVWWVLMLRLEMGSWRLLLNPLIEFCTSQDHHHQQIAGHILIGNSFFNC